MRPCHPVAVLVLALGACVETLDSPSQVTDLRVLAVKAEPPELAFPSASGGGGAGVPVTVTVLAADPRQPDRPVTWSLRACPLPRASLGAKGSRCADATTRADLGGQTTPLDSITAAVQPPGSVLQAALEEDPQEAFNGLTIQLEVEVQGEGEQVFALKRLVYDLSLPEGATPNRNPLIRAVRVGAASVEDGGSFVFSPGEAVEMEIEPEDGSAEDYVVATYSGGTERATEFLSYAFYATGGSFSHDATGRNPDKGMGSRTDDLFSKWTAEATPEGHVTFYFVVRDGRGGCDFASLEGVSRSFE